MRIEEWGLGARQHARERFLEGEVAADGGDADALHDGGGKYDFGAGLKGGDAECGGGGEGVAAHLGGEGEQAEPA